MSGNAPAFLKALKFLAVGADDWVRPPAEAVFAFYRSPPSTSGVGIGGDLLVVWPGAETSFMDPGPAANVVGSGSDASTRERVTCHVRPFGAAG